MRRSPLALPALVAILVLCVEFGAGPAMAQSSDPFQPPAATSASEEPSAREKPAAKAPVKEPERIVKTNEEWQKLLKHEEFMVTRMKATEAAFSGKYAAGHWTGTFLCVCCGARLFEARHKFDSGTGWPSFDRPVTTKALESAWDYTESEARVEVTCRRCGAHLGHVFQDGPTSTGLRFCINSLALKLDSDKQAAAPAAKKKSSRTQTARSSRKSQTTRSSSSAAVEKPQPTEDAKPPS